jgi:hypothetical protein
MGPTELRIVLAIGTLMLLRSDSVVIAGRSFLLFDVGGVVAIAGLLATFASAAISNTRKLYLAEPRHRANGRDGGALRVLSV